MTSRKLRIGIGLSVLLFSALLVFMLSLFFLPRTRVKSRICAMPFRNAILSNVCSSSVAHRVASNSIIDGSHNSNARTLGIATSIFVISLARRTDRRQVMDMLLGDALGLNWSYFDALDKNDPLVNRILFEVSRLRVDASNSSFKWPDTLEEARKESFGLEKIAYDDTGDRNVTTEPLLCATGDNNIPSYTNSSSAPFHKKLSKGMIACWYSHIQLLENIVKHTRHVRNDSWDGREGVTVIFEDDVDVEWDMRERLEKMWVDLPQEWDIVVLGHCWSNELFHPSITPTSPLHPSHRPKCTHGYVVSPFGARRLLSHLSYAPFAFSRALDQAIAHLISTRRIRSFSVVPSIVVQRRCPPGNSTSLECAYGSADNGDSDIWVNGGKKGSKWRDSLEDSALERIHKGQTHTVLTDGPGIEGPEEHAPDRTVTADS
ncbi:uncharacterized protein FOMMEDRAFT_162718 [Fomitiporia mediterranea MF3/22]|uniref:Glycosyl transferase family 25 domain-containing protein n=1 Tax=Fomitiporia mediterranea (strain MF3/22) TaxID=694068 RepID=R7SH12_FOMME|nr:uncharacterized protein FOMMEDRAFT_162718 [Fomitiporia mediterranea MF3/22]EJC97695.1 hypothetical protein FOMMEDRAFT_162718 [Fomitiporia mediterranea MF3/22]